MTTQRMDSSSSRDMDHDSYDIYNHSPPRQKDVLAYDLSTILFENQSEKKHERSVTSNSPRPWFSKNQNMDL
jgi:hypothetical protein